MSSAWRRLTISLRARPRAWAIGGGVGVTAVLTGVLLSLAIASGPRGSGQLVDDEGSSVPSDVATAVPSDGPEEPASPTATPEASATATPGASSVASPTSTPGSLPRATSTPPPGCCYVPGWDIEGEWTALPPMPDAERWRLSDVITLDDGTVVVFRWLTQPEGADPAERVLAWSPGTSGWVEVRTEPILTGTDAQFALGGDGRVYSYDNVIDPSTTPWSVEPFALADPSETYAGYGLDAGPDGRIYRPATTPIDRVTLEIYDPVTDARETSTSLTGHHGSCVLGSDTLVYIVDMVMFAGYDPTTDTWSSPITTPGDRDCIGAGFGPDGRLYLASMWSGADIMAWDTSTEGWLSVEPPPAAEGFRPRFVTGPDGHLWAIDPDTSFVFVPDR